VLLVNEYRTGSMYTLLRFDTSGKKTGELDISSQVKDIACADKYTAVLYGSTVGIYDQNMIFYAGCECGRDTSDVVLRGDATAVLAGQSRAALFVP